jgi:hypothetical protein
MRNRIINNLAPLMITDHDISNMIRISAREYVLMTDQGYRAGVVGIGLQDERIPHLVTSVSGMSGMCTLEDAEFVPFGCVTISGAVIRIIRKRMATKGLSRVFLNFYPNGLEILEFSVSEDPGQNRVIDKFRADIASLDNVLRWIKDTAIPTGTVFVESHALCKEIILRCVVDGTFSEQNVVDVSFTRHHELLVRLYPVDGYTARVTPVYYSGLPFSVHVGARNLIQVMNVMSELSPCTEISFCRNKLRLRAVPTTQEETNDLELFVG